MNRARQTVLIALFVVVVLVFSADRLKSFVLAPVEKAQQRKTRLESKIAAQRKTLAKTVIEAKQLEEWKRQSLPRDPQQARSAYQAWLLQLVTQVGLTNHSVDAGEPGNRGGLVHPILFNVQGRGTLEQITQFLHEFYRAGHLHQVRTLSLNPVGRRDLFDLSLSIEGLVLANADRTDKLAEGHSDRLAFGSLDAYQVIARRNLFGTTGSSDPTDHAKLTGIEYVNGEPEAWFTLETEPDPDKASRRLRVGGILEIGQFTAKIAAIDDNDVVLDVDGERWLLSIGETLAQAYALPPGL